MNFLFWYLIASLLFVGYSAWVIPKKIPDISNKSFAISLLINFLIWPVMIMLSLPSLFRGIKSFFKNET